MRRFATLATGFVLLATAAFCQDTRYVNGSTGTNTGNCTVNPCATITYALNQAVSGDTVEIADGIYTETFAINKSVTLQGQSQVGTIIQAHASQGAATNRVITIAGAFEVTIADVTIRHGVATGPVNESIGGGILSQGATLSLSNVTLRRNTAMVGGGVGSLGGEVTLLNSTFNQNTAVEDNFAGGAGGGMFNHQNTALLINVTFSSNHADIEAGGMENVDNTATLQNVTFNQNTANNSGGAMYNWLASVSLSEVTIFGNSASWGAGMYTIGNSTLTLRHVSFTENGVAFAGGAMYNNTAGSVELTHVTLSGNAAGSGGGIYNENTSPTLFDVHFTGNTAGTNGGGMYNTSDSSPVLTDVTFTTNTVSGPNARGGGMYNDGAFTTLTDVIFTGNKALGTIGACGGGMVNAGISTTLTNVTFTDNTARAGGGLCNMGGSSPTLAGVTFDSNQANSGGGLYSGEGSSPQLISVIFSDNTALPGTVGSGGGFGGGIYNAGSSPTLSDVIFTGNVAEEGAGGMMNSGGSANLTNVTFIGNTSAGSGLVYGGGAMRNNNSSVVLTSVEFIGNESAASAGGIHHTEGSLHLTDVTLNENISAADLGRSGGGIRISDSEAVFTNVTFTDNEALSGAGMHISGGSLLLTNGVFVGNTTGIENTNSRGGGIQIDGSNGSLINVAFFNNQSFSGGGLSVEASSIELINATFSGNHAGTRGGGIEIQFSGSYKLFNTIIWGNTAGNSGNEIFSSNSIPVELFYSAYSNQPGDLFGDFDIEDSITDDPLFADSGHGDLRLQEESPAIDAGDPTTDLSLFPGGPGSPVDLDNAPRVRGGRIDIGAYEFQSIDPPENDNISDAVVIPIENAIYQSSNVHATLEENEPEPSCTFSDWTTNFSVWWTFTAESNGHVSIHTNGSETPEGDGLDTILSLHNAGNLSEVACDDDGGDGTQSFVEQAHIISGETYLIRVAGYNESAFNQGTIHLNVVFQTVSDEPTSETLSTTLSAPSPNPVRGTAALTLTVDREQDVTVAVFDVMGRRVQTLFSGDVAAQQVVQLQVDASSLSAGLYVIRATGERFVETQKMTVVK